MRREQDQQSGFTLIELLIVASVISIIASIAVPSFVRGRATANEGAVIGTLRSISKAQFQFKAQNLVDVDIDGGFEYGTLGEITGTRFLRGTAEKLAPKLMSESLGAVDPTTGALARHGYLMALYLPDSSGVGLAETPGNETAIDAALAADYWTFLAWPMHDQQGRSTFFVNQQGQVMKTAAKYFSTSNVPPAGAALAGVPPNQVNAQRLAVGVVGADGNVWVPVH